MPKEAILPANPQHDTQGQRIDRVIRKSGLEKQFIAQHVMGVSRSQLSQFMCDMRNASPQHLLRLAEHLKLPLDKVMLINTDKDVLSLPELLASDVLLEKFFHAPLDNRLRSWIRASLRTMFDTVNREKPRLMDKRKKLLAKRKALEAAKEIERADQKLERSRSEDHTERIIKKADEEAGEYGTDETIG